MPKHDIHDYSLVKKKPIAKKSICMITKFTFAMGQMQSC
jgi:hypothetical protein